MAQPNEKLEVIVEISGGVVFNVSFPDGVRVIVRDYDTVEHSSDDDRDYAESIHERN